MGRQPRSGVFGSSTYHETPARPRRFERSCSRGDFIARAHGLGIQAVLTPIATPHANGVAEQLVGTLRRERLDHVIVMNGRRLRRVLREFAAHSNDARLRIPRAVSFDRDLWRAGLRGEQRADGEQA